MTLPPYQFANGDAYGEPEAPVATGPRSSTDRPRRAPNRLQLAARRARIDPLWKDRTRASRRLLLDLDAAEAAEQARRDGGQR